MADADEPDGPNTLAVFDRNSQTIQKFKTTTDEWHTTEDGFTEDMRSWSFTAAMLRKALLVFMSNKTVYRFQHSSTGPEWQKLPSTKSNHGQYPPVVVSKGSIYMIGTAGLGLPTERCERYSIKRREWVAIKDMTRARKNHALVAADGGIYCIGGLGKPGTLYSVEKYDLRSKVWTEVDAIKEPRHSAAAVASSDDIFVMGGIVCGKRKSDLLCLSMPSAMCVSLTRMSITRTLFSAFIIDGKIFAVGGDNSLHDTVEVYDAASDRWTFMDILSTLQVEAAVCIRM